MCYVSVLHFNDATLCYTHMLSFTLVHRSLAFGHRSVAAARRCSWILLGCSTPNRYAQIHILDPTTSLIWSFSNGPIVRSRSTVLIVASATWCGACRGEASDLEALYQQYKNSNFTIITLLGENSQGQSPSIGDLQQWASDFGITHPVLADVGFNTTASYLWADPNFNGNFYLPNMQLLSQGQVVEVLNSQLYESQIVSYIQ